MHIYSLPSNQCKQIPLNFSLDDDHNFWHYCQVDSVFLQNITGDHAQDLSDSTVSMNGHLTKDIPQETLFQTNDPWNIIKNDTTTIHS